MTTTSYTTIMITARPKRSRREILTVLVLIWASTIPAFMIASMPLWAR